MKSRLRKYNAISYGGRCPETGKAKWLTKADAKMQARRAHPGERMSAYVCTSCGFWHIGHLPARVRRGIDGREALRRKGTA
jgi:hypothetical protein